MNWYKQARKTLSEEDCGEYIVRNKLIDDFSPSDPEFEMEMAYAKSPGQCYLGTPKDAKELFDKYDFDPKSLCSPKAQNDDEDDMSCTIAFEPKSQNWYGWSHRAIHGFGIGDKPATDTDEGYDTDHGKPAKTLEEAKGYAIDFADSVS